jgi:hypothetical protein
MLVVVLVPADMFQRINHGLVMFDGLRGGGVGIRCGKMTWLTHLVGGQGQPLMRLGWVEGRFGRVLVGG